MKQTVEFDLDGKTVTLETGRLAKQAGGAVLVSCGDTRVLVTATSAADPREGIDFSRSPLITESTRMPPAVFPVAISSVRAVLLKRKCSPAA